MSRNNYIENVLLSGYLREHEESVDIAIPNLVSSVLSVYCKQYNIQKMGALYKNCLITMDPSDCNEYRIFKSNSNKPTKTTSPFKFECAYKYDMDKNEDMLKQIDIIIHSHPFFEDDGIIDIQYSSKHALFLTSTGNVYTFGSNESGQAGLDADIHYIETPKLIPFQSKIKAIACGELHSLFIDENGKLLVCGYNYCGQLGIDHEVQKQYTMNNVYTYHSDTTSIVDRSDIIDFEQISEGKYYFIDESDDDETDDGFNDLEYQCIYTPIFNPYFDGLDIRFINIDCGAYHSLAITTNGECYTFGHNGFGNLGNGKYTEWGEGVNIPYKVNINKKIVNGSCGNNHNVLITENNEIVVFGDNTNNQCSIMDTDKIENPLTISKEIEFGILETSFIEKIVCMNNTSLSVIDVYKRCISNK